MMDEKGKLFGKINLVDLLVILVIIVAVVLVVVKIVRPNSGTVAGDHLSYTVFVEGVRPDVYEQTKSYLEGPFADEKGDQMMANGALFDGYVTGVTATPHINYGIDAAGQTVVSVEQNGRLDLLFTVEAKVNDKVASKVGTQEVRVGKMHIVKTANFEFERGTIISCNWKPAAPAA